MPTPGTINVAQVVLEILVPTAGPAPISPTVKITLRGVKRVRQCPPEQNQQFRELPALPSVKRAM